MTERNSFKRRVRARMARTGESYSTARRLVRNAHPEPSDKATKLRVSLVQPAVRTGDLETDLDVLFQALPTPTCDVLVLPELIACNASPATYEAAMRSIAMENRCHVVGGSAYAPAPDGKLNAGLVVDQSGKIVSRYEKFRPYGAENGAGVSRGKTSGTFEVAGRTFAVMICADMWFSESFALLGCEPDVLLIPSFSITQREDPDKARRLWQHMMIARAYEYAAYVGVCDWAHPCEFEGLPAAGVSGFADPRPNGESFFAGNGDDHIRTYTLDFERLESFRSNRVDRGFASLAGERG